MFTYNNLKILSATPLRDIEQYLGGLGAERNERGTYTLGGIEVAVIPVEAASFGKFDIPRHEISVTGNRAAAESFLTGFRLRFLSLGG